MKKIFTFLTLSIIILTFSGCSKIFHEKITMKDLLPYNNPNMFFASKTSYKAVNTDAAICQYDVKLARKLNTKYNRGVLIVGIPNGHVRKYNRFNKYYKAFIVVFTKKGYGKIYKQFNQLCQTVTTIAMTQ